VVLRDERKGHGSNKKATPQDNEVRDDLGAANRGGAKEEVVDESGHYGTLPPTQETKVYERRRVPGNARESEPSWIGLGRHNDGPIGFYGSVQLFYKGGPTERSEDDDNVVGEGKFGSYPFFHLPMASIGAGAKRHDDIRKAFEGRACLRKY